MGVQRGHKEFDLTIKLFTRSDGSEIMRKVIPQQCLTVAEAAFCKISTGLGQSKFVSLFLSS